MAASKGVTTEYTAPYKNKSDVFAHLTDDPSDRQGKNMGRPINVNMMIG